MKLKELKKLIEPSTEIGYEINGVTVYIHQEDELVNNEMEVISITSGNCEELWINLRPL